MEAPFTGKKFDYLYAFTVFFNHGLILLSSYVDETQDNLLIDTLRKFILPHTLYPVSLYLTFLSFAYIISKSQRVVLGGRYCTDNIRWQLISIRRAQGILVQD